MGSSHFNTEKKRKIFTLFYRKPLEVIQLTQCKWYICSCFGVNATILAATFTVTFTAYDSYIRWLWLIDNFIQTNKLYSQAMFALYWIAFTPPRKSYRIELLFTHKNCCGGAFSVTEQSCAAPMSKVESQISKRCSHYTGWLLGRHENHIGLGFCSHTRTALAARFLWRSEAAPRRSLKRSVTYRRGVHSISDSFCTTAKIISDWASVHT